MCLHQRKKELVKLFESSCPVGILDKCNTIAKTKCTANRSIYDFQRQ